MKRNKHSLSHYKLASFNMGELIPVGLTEVLPGDSMQQATSALLRCSPLLAPVMHPVHARIHHWYVPHRLIWEDFEKFITGGPDGMDASVYPTITIGGGGAALGSLADYLGVPTSVNNIEVSALPFRGYALIWNEWYRDQDLQTALTIDLTSGADTTTSVALQNVCWEKDYFTSSRPWEQKGPSITIPIGNQAPVMGIGVNTGANAVNNGVNYVGVNAAGDALVQSGDPGYQVGEGIASKAWTLAMQTAGVPPSSTNRPNIYADLSSASAITVNALREALSLQRFEEARARYGSRYTEYLRYLGIRSSDARLQRPEYLGGGKQTIQFSEVLATAQTEVDTEVTDVGALRGHGIGAMRSNRYRRFFEEHGYVFTFVSCKPRTMYIQGLARHWNRRVKEDFWQKEMEHIGQQEVLNKEVYAAHATPNGVFGYQDRYDEYRRTESTIAGEFRTSLLNFWHMARDFGSDPALNADFVKCVPTERIFADNQEHTMYGMFNHSIQARRLVTATGTSFIY